MAITNVVTRGYGPSASIAFVTTRGFSIAELEVFIDTPASRTYLVAPDLRTLEVPEDSRTLIVPPRKQSNEVI